MPFYEYIHTGDQFCDHCKEGFEVRRSIKADDLLECPNCGTAVKKKIVGGASSITLGREMNQFNDVKHAKYWRDRNGIRHKVTAADGSRSSPTVSKKITTTPAQREAIKKRDKLKTKKRLQRIKHGFIKKP